MAKQTPGSVITACESCRSRKVKCDKVHPQCRPCAKLGLECVFIHERVKKGPRKGELGRLKAQVASLEQKLAVQQAGDQSTSPTIYAAAPSEVAAGQEPTLEYITPQTLQSEPELHHVNGQSNLVSDIYVGDGTDKSWYTRADPEFMAWLDLTLSSPALSLPLNHNSRHSSIWDTTQPSAGLDKMTKADLEATYFDRAHSFMPLLHRNRFHSWADLETVTPSQECLRYAVWTVAAALCPRFHDMYEGLYAHTRNLLQCLDGGEQGHLWTPLGAVHLEQVQAWLLIGHCDFIRHDRNMAIMSASRITRLVQAARFNFQHAAGNISNMADLSVTGCVSNTTEAALEEETGRAFWVAFCFDRMVHSLDHGHFDLQDESAHLSLPCSETAYQASEPAKICTLAQALDGPCVDIGSHFAESIVAVTLYGRCLTHRRLAAAAKAREKAITTNMGHVGTTLGNHECQKRHTWLRQALDLRFLAGKQTSITALTPLLALAHLLNLGCIVHVVETLIEHIDYPEQHVDQVYNAYNAAVSIGQFTATLPQAACFKMHPLIPIILSQAYNFVKKYQSIIQQDPDPTTTDQTLQCLVLQLQKFENVHVAAKEFLENQRSST